MRLEDNHGLFEALKSGNNVIPIFIFDKNILEKLQDKQDARVTFIYDTIGSLKDKIQIAFANQITEVNYPPVLISNMDKVVRKTEIALLVFSIILAVLVIFIIDNTIKLAMFSNRFLIKTMQMVGATRWFIAKPMDIRAIINGAIAGFVAIVCILGLIIIAENQLPELRALQDTSSLILLCVGLLLLGVCISLFSTHRSILKYLKRKLVIPNMV